MAMMEPQAGEDGYFRIPDPPPFEDRAEDDILSDKGKPWASKTLANRRLRDLPNGYRLARTAKGWVIKPEDIANPGATIGQGPAEGPGSDAGNGFKQGPKAGERYRVGVVAFVGGAVSLEKRLPAGTVATFYIGKDGNLIDGDSVNLIGDGQDRLWIPATPEQAQQAQAILDEMGRLELNDPARKDAKARLKALVQGKPTQEPNEAARPQAQAAAGESAAPAAAPAPQPEDIANPTETPAGGQPVSTTKATDEVQDQYAVPETEVPAGPGPQGGADGDAQVQEQQRLAQGQGGQDGASLRLTQDAAAPVNTPAPAKAGATVAAAPAGESDQDRSNREWRENYQTVVGTADLNTISARKVEQAINYAAKVASNLGPKAWAGDEDAKKLIDSFNKEADLLKFHLKTREKPAAAPANQAPIKQQPVVAPEVSSATPGAQQEPSKYATGSTVTLDGKRYTVAKTGKASVTLEGEDGKKRTVQVSGAAYAKIQRVEAPAAESAPSSSLGVVLGEGVNTNLSQPSSDSVSMVAGLFGDLPQRQALIEKGFDGLSVSDQASVLTQVLRGIQDLKILRAIVELVPIDVVNMLAGKQLSAQDLLSDPSVLKHALSVPRNGPVPAGVARIIDQLATGLQSKGTSPTAEVSPVGADFSRGSVDGSPATETVDRGQSAAPSSAGTPIVSDRTKDAAKPATPLYASRAVTNAQAIIDWARSQGFKSTLKPEDLHVTIAYSRDAVDGAALPKDAAILTASGGKRSVEPLGEEGAVVLKFNSPELQARWKAYRAAGASWDYDAYTPHVTITYDGKGVDLAKVQPYTGPIELGAEQQGPLNVNKKDDYKESSAPPPAEEATPSVPEPEPAPATVPAPEPAPEPAPPPPPARRAPKSFRKTVQVTTQAYIEESKKFEPREMDAETALSAIYEDIKQLKAFRACITKA